MDSRTTTTEIVSEVIKDFDARKKKGDLAPRCNIVLLTAASMLKKIITERSFSETFKQECDVIIVGAVIFVLAWEDFNNGVPQECFGNQYLYPLNYGDPGLKECENKEKTEDQIKRFGKSALLDHTIPFISIPENVFPDLAEIIPPDHFDCYHLNIDPATMDTTERTQKYFKVKERMEEIAKKREEEREAYNKWIKPFGWPEKGLYEWSNPHAAVMPGRMNKAFISRQLHVSVDFKLQNSHPDRQSQKNWRIVLVVALGIIFLPSLCITIPWILKKEKEEQDKLPLQKRTFTLQQYEDIKQQRAQFKRLLQSHQAAVEIKKEDKFKKICTGYDAKRKELYADKEAIRTIDMFCDQEQAMKRWNPSFLANLIKKAKSGVVKDQEEAFQAYKKSQAQSKQLKEQHTSLTW